MDRYVDTYVQQYGDAVAWQELHEKHLMKHLYILRKL